MGATRHSPEVEGLLRAVRDARFASGRACVHCHSGAVQRWGCFSGRQRYRCMGCGRTFSDLTLTPLSYTKRLHCWPDFLGCWRRADSVRRTASLLRVHTTTAFRWRHWLCDAIRETDFTELSGWTEALELRFIYSDKGRSNGSRRSEKRAYSRAEHHRRGRVIVLILYDRNGRVLSGIVGESRLVASRAADHFAPAMAGVNAILSGQGRFGSMSALARWFRIQHLDARPARRRDPSVHLLNATSHARGLVAWLDRFRGVATRYLPNYLAWYRQLEPFIGRDPAVWLLTRTCTLPDQQPSRTEFEGSAGGSADPRGPPVG